MKFISQVGLLFLVSYYLSAGGWRFVGIGLALFLVQVPIYYLIISLTFQQTPGTAVPSGIETIHDLIGAPKGVPCLIGYKNPWDQNKLYGLFYKNEAQGERPLKERQVLLFFHGARSNALMHHHWMVNFCKESGVDCLMADYRGFGMCAGNSNEFTLYGDGLAAYYYLLSQGYTHAQIIVFGVSLGSVPATFVTQCYGAKGLILKAGITHFNDVGSNWWKQHLPIFPFFLLRSYVWATFFLSLNNLSFFGQLKLPTLLIYGDKDKMTPAWLGHKLAAQRQKGVLFFSYKGAHSDYPAHLDERVMEFLKKELP